MGLDSARKTPCGTLYNPANDRARKDLRADCPSYLRGVQRVRGEDHVEDYANFS